MWRRELTRHGRDESRFDTNGNGIDGRRAVAILVEMDGNRVDWSRHEWI